MWQLPACSEGSDVGERAAEPVNYATVERLFRSGASNSGEGEYWYASEC